MGREAMCLVIVQSVNVKYPGATLSYSLLPNVWFLANFIFTIWRGKKGSNTDITHDV